MLAMRGMSHVHWDMDAREYLKHDAGLVKRYLIRKIGKLKGRGVLLMHDTQPITAKVLPALLTWIVEENARRRAAGERPIRIVSYADIVLERLVPALRRLFWAPREHFARLTSRIARRLLAPLAGLPGTARPAGMASPRL